jgi:DNA-binding LacI/PurR family transcriptional regulator
MLEIGVDGFILASVRLKEPIVDKLIQQGTPVVLVNRKLASENASYVVIDNYQGAYLVVEHLIKNGCRNIAIINSSTNLSTAVERFKGYKKVLVDYGLTLRPEYVANGSFTQEHGYTAAKKMLAMPNRPDAIFAASNRIAIGVIKAAHELGLRIPDDLALVGFDDTELTSIPGINLTTVSQKKYEMGRLGVKVITDLIEGTEANFTNRIVLQPDLIIRSSGGCEKHKSCVHVS